MMYVDRQVRHGRYIIEAESEPREGAEGPITKLNVKKKTLDLVLVLERVPDENQRLLVHRGPALHRRKDGVQDWRLAQAPSRCQSALLFGWGHFIVP